MPIKTMTYYLLTLGCPKNDVVSEKAASTLISLGLTGTDDPRYADIICINGCSFIASAVTEVKREIEEIVAGKMPHQKVIIFGCLAQRFKSPDSIGLTGVDGFYSSFERVVTELDISPHTVKSPRLPIFKTYGYVEIAQGCSKRCAYCTIPLFKGPFRSKHVDLIMEEIRELTNAGVQEIILVAQETTFYGSDVGSSVTLARLIRQITLKFPLIPRIRILYAHPLGVTDELIATIKECPAVCHYIDIPLQHASNKILRSMNRPPVSISEKALDKLKTEMPDISLRSTFIVGYPGETESDIVVLKAFLQKWQFDKVGFFAYSPEPETESFALHDRVPDDTKQKRLKDLYAFQNRIALKKNRSLIGHTMEVLVEEVFDSSCKGRSYREAPEIDGQIIVQNVTQIGSIINVKITAADSSNLESIINL